MLDKNNIKTVQGINHIILSALHLWSSNQVLGQTEI